MCSSTPVLRTGAHPPAPQSPLSFLLSLTLGVKRRRAVELGQADRLWSDRPRRRAYIAKRKNFWECWLPSYPCLCLKVGMNLPPLEVVCSITGFEEAVRRSGGWEHTATAGAAAAPNSQCAPSEQRQGDNTDPRVHWGAAISDPGGSFTF